MAGGPPFIQSSRHQHPVRLVPRGGDEIFGVSRVSISSVEQSGNTIDLSREPITNDGGFVNSVRGVGREPGRQLELDCLSLRGELLKQHHRAQVEMKDRVERDGFHCSEKMPFEQSQSARKLSQVSGEFQMPTDVSQKSEVISQELRPSLVVLDCLFLTTEKC